MKRLHLVEAHTDSTVITHSFGCAVEECAANISLSAWEFASKFMERLPEGAAGSWLWATAKFEAARGGPGKHVDWSDLE